MMYWPMYDREGKPSHAAHANGGCDFDHPNFVFWLKDQGKTLEQWLGDNPPPKPVEPPEPKPTVEDRLAALEAEIVKLKEAAK